ncbi:MAG TPA: aminotransferase class IV [Clostridia bacterium]|nr:aminotransferase class IV [Clostridia bacterium]
MEKIYEVLRVLEGKPVFLKEHLDRLQNSWLFYHSEPMDSKTLKKEILALASQGLDPHNIRIEVEIEGGAYLLTRVEGAYPSQEMKEKGVDLATYKHMRHNPQVKAIDPLLNERAQAFRQEKGVYSLLYVYEGEVGECQRANIFFIRDGVLITARDEDVLLGVTRQKVLEIAQDLNLPLVKRIVRQEELFTMEAAFMTGTSIHILPVRKIDGFAYNVEHPFLEKLSREMDRQFYEEERVVESEDTQEEKDFERGGQMKKLYRSDDAKLAGVCGGLGEYLQVDPNVIRILWIIFAAMGGSGILAYLLAALIIPKRNES